MNRLLASIFTLSFLAALCASPAAFAQTEAINNLTGGVTAHQSCIGETWDRHEWDIIFPAEYRGETVSEPAVMYRLWSEFNEGVVGGFTDGDDGAYLIGTVASAVAVNVTPPGTAETDDYYIFTFPGQTLDVPLDGVVWFHFEADGDGDCQQARDDIGALGTFTTTYEQNDEVRPGGTSFIVYEDGNSLADLLPEGEEIEPTVPVPVNAWWALLALMLGLGGLAWHRLRVS